MIDDLLERTPAEGAVNVLHFKEFCGEGWLEDAAVISKPGDVGATLLAYQFGASTRSGKSNGEIERDGGGLVNQGAVIDERRHFAERVRVRRIACATAVAAADGDNLHLVRRADFLQQPERTERARFGSVIEREHPAKLDRGSGFLKRARQYVQAQGARELAIGAAGVDARNQRRQRHPGAERFGFERRPELRLQSDRGAVPGNGEGALLQHHGSAVRRLIW